MRGCAVLLPGRAYGTRAPLLALAHEVLVADGWEVRPVAWDAPAPVPGSVEPAVAERFVVRHLREATADLTSGGHDVLVVAKSLGTRAAAYAAARAWSAVWMTPLLRDTSCRGGIATNPAPQLLVGGTADPYWDPAGAGSLRRSALVDVDVDVVEVAGADHGMVVVGETGATAATLERVGGAVGAFARRLRAP